MVKKVISKEAKPKRVVTNLKPNKKAPTKSELECQVKNLQLANDALEESNRQKIKLLESFEAKISNLENQIEYLSHKDIMHSKETQTEANLNLKCDECNFEAEYERELGWHMGKMHGWPSEQKGETMDIAYNQWIREIVINVVMKQKASMSLMLTFGRFMMSILNATFVMKALKIKVNK